MRSKAFSDVVREGFAFEFLAKPIKRDGTIFLFFLVETY